MKQNIGIFLGVLGFLAGIYYAISINKSEPFIAKNAVDQRTTEQPEELPPAMDQNGTFAYVNQGRLQKLAASNYKGPSFKEDYSGLEHMVAARKLSQDRMPASAPTPVETRKNK